MNGKKKQIDTVIVPVREENEYIFLNEKRYHSIRIASKNLKLIKFIAFYQTAPKSHIEYYAEVLSISKLENTNKYELLFKGNIKTLTNKIKYPAGNKSLIIRGSKYVQIEKLVRAKTLKEVLE